MKFTTSLSIALSLAAQPVMAKQAQPEISVTAKCHFALGVMQDINENADTPSIETAKDLGKAMDFYDSMIDKYEVNIDKEESRYIAELNQMPGGTEQALKAVRNKAAACQMLAKILAPSAA